MKILKKILIIIIILFFWFVIFIQCKTPLLERNWTEDQIIMPKISYLGSVVSIKDVRNLKYTTTDEYEISHYDENYDINKLENLYYIVEPFSSFNWPAHTMLSFGFENWKYVTISAEIRKEKWESFWPIKWIQNSYELIYVVWDENDLVKLRANYRKDNVYMYPIKTDKDKIQKLFLSMLKRTEKLTKEPEFYNTITNNCTTNILNHVNEIRNDKISWSFEALLPANSDKVIYELWLIDTSLSFEEARKYYKINELSEEHWDNSNYSQLIRKERK